MTTFLLTHHPVFRHVVLDEVRAVDPGAVQLGPVAPSVLHVRPALGEAAFAAGLREALPVFVRHAAPVQQEIPLGEADDPVAVVAAAFEPERLRAGVPFAVQCRKLGAAAEAPFRGRDLEVRLGMRLEAMGFPVDLHGPRQVVSIALVPGRALAGVCAAEDCLAPRADEYRRFSQCPSPVSRAEFKLREALEVLPDALPGHGRALDVGAAPGGWTRVLAERGLHVTAVDPGALAPDVLADPLVTHLRTRLELAELEPGYDLLINDMNLEPAESAALTCEAARHLAPGAAAIVTIKLPVRRPLALLGGTLAILQLAYELRGLRSLFHNRQEVTAFLRRRPELHGGWEALLGHDRAAEGRRRDWLREHAQDELDGAVPAVLRRDRAGAPQSLAAPSRALAHARRSSRAGSSSSRLGTSNTIVERRTRS